jgi:hypothetical protein
MYSTNPLNIIAGSRVYTVPEEVSPNQIIHLLGFRFVRPTILLVDGHPWGRIQWDSRLSKNSHVLFMECPQGAGAFTVISIIIAVGSLAYSFIASRLTPVTDIPETVYDQKSTYSFSDGTNKINVGNPFAEHFGRCRIYPDLIQQSYVRNIKRYDDDRNYQYLYFLGVIGVGEYDVEEVYINNSPLLQYENSEYFLFGPGEFETGISGIAPEIVWTCNELSVQEVVYYEWIFYIVDPPGTEINQIEYDIVFENGLYCPTSGSDLPALVRIRVECRTVDKVGTSTSDWFILDIRDIWSEWDSSYVIRDPLRFSYKVPTPLGKGRYQIRIKRIEVNDFAVSDPSYQSLLDAATETTRPTLTGLRGYGAPHPDYGDVTIFFARIKATDQLNGNVASQINIVATRKLGEVTSTGVGVTLLATRSIIDAIGYLVTSANCGQQSIDLVDWESLDELRATFETAGYHFDYSFTSRVSVMDAVAKAAACGRAAPCMPGGLFSVVQDVDQEVPSCVYTNDNITDLAIVTNPRTADNPTCVNVIYTNPDTWDDEIVSCYDEDGSEDTPNEISLEGCTSRQQAYEIGMFLYYQNKLERVSVSFVTNAAGYIPQLLSKILVPNKMTNWGASGLIVSVDRETIWLSEPVDFYGEEEGLLYVVLEDGTTGGPYTVEPTSYAHAVTGSIEILSTLTADGLKASRFLFGVDATDKLLVRVGSITPNGRDSVRISGTIVDHSVYDNPGTVPEIEELVWEQELLDSINLIYTGESVIPPPGRWFRLTWVGDAEMVFIEFDTGSGYTELVDEFTSYSILFMVAPETVTISVRVTPYDGSSLETGEALEATWVEPSSPMSS